ncbi:hypothetical protein, variant [Aphanomyces astaci]|uniref:PH domain-containing protein n=1 Tax=Aphanomyces astaci TaxID=112090 RepID=W4GCQ8_APHAT|nr:hypothetical protein, variant [Aphanomyces astaci]ETV77460.1 hypothetical protein, variant [Aphanomyces astaci]|eukprot:XP_009833247.1 hypothetical protein, variant [Aphanomyces astaci]
MALRQLAAPSTTARPRGASFGSDVSDEDKTKIQPTTASVSTTAAPSLVRRASSKRWYSDSDDEGGGGDDNYANNQAGSMSSLQASSIASAASSSTSAMHRRASASAFIPSRAGTITEKAPPPPALDLTAPPATGSLPDIPRPVSGFHKLVQKTKILSPFRSKSSKHLNGAAANQPHDDHPPDSAPVASSAGPVLQRRHSSRMILRASSTDTPLAPTPEDEPDDAFQLNVLHALSPGRGALGGAIPGVPGSGVLLEGWLRQKQRRGLRGLKAWNSRYFVLFKNPNEMRYYTDVVQSGWGPIPLNELGCISLRSIQRISKPSHPKYKGCRFDITCRLPSTTAATTGDYDVDGLVSSGDERDKPASKTTPRATREFCLVSDSPQSTVTWVAMLDSLLTRSVNSPRPEAVGGRRGSSSNTNCNQNHNTSGGGGSLKALITQNNIRQKAALGGFGAMTSTTTTTTTSTPSSGVSTTTPRTPQPALAHVSPRAAVTVFSLPHDVVPKAIVLAIEYIFESFPGIETEHFYSTTVPPPSRLQVQS